MNPASPGAIAARLRGRKFDTPQDVADAVAVAINGFYKHQTNRKGMYDNSIVTVDGGTKFSPTDNSAGRKSTSLQPPQHMVLRKQGAISMRQQLRADSETRTLPARVLSVEGTGADAVVTVAVVGDGVALYTDSISNQLVVGNPLDPLNYEDILNYPSEMYQIRMAGNPFVDSGADGPQIPTPGQTINITVTTQSEKRTIWHTRNGVNEPRVVNYDQGSSATMVNGVCCHGGDGGGGGGS